jgi:magnesium chelatase family protein
MPQNNLLAHSLNRIIYSREQTEISGTIHAGNRAGTPSFTIVGLPDNAVKESRERVRAAINNMGLQFPNSAYSVFLSFADRTKQK